MSKMPKLAGRRIREGDIVETPWQKNRFIVWSVRDDTLVVYGMHDHDRFLRLVSKSDVQLIED